MDAKAKRSPRLDHLDAERFRDMLVSPPFDVLRKRLEIELERARLDCERHREPEDIYRAQGAAAALRTALALPTTILREIDTKGPK